MEETEIVEGIVKGFTDSLIGEAKNIFSDLADEAKQFINIGLKEYLEKQKEKYSHIKTILRGATPVYLYDIYYPLKLECKNKIYETNSVKDIFADSNYLTIIGDAGSGKSTLVKHLFLNAINEKFAIPILIELRYLNDFEGDVESFIKEKIFENQLSQNDEILARLLKKGKFLFFLDGFDEIISSTKHKIVKNLNSFINVHHKNKFILTSRPYSNIEHLPLFHNLKVQELSLKDVDDFIDKQLIEENELAVHIKESIRINKNSFLDSFIKNPLLLSIYILTYQSNPKIPNKKYLFYRRVIQVLFSEHDSKSKLAYNREILSKLGQEHFEEVLKRFCFLSYFESKFNFELEYVNTKLNEIKSKNKFLKFENDKLIYDLKLSIALWLEDNGLYSFAHRSLQEYFTAYFIQGLNDENKKSVYDKIKNKSAVNRFGENENLISLCEEMDSLAFLKMYYLPILNDFKSLIDKESKLEAMKNLVKICGTIVFIKEMVHTESIDHGIYFMFSADFHRFLYVFDEQLRQLYHTIKRQVHMIANTDGFEQKFIIKKTKENDYQIDIVKNFGRVFKGQRRKDLHKLLNSTLEFIDKEIEKSEKYLSTANQSDKELIAMI